MGKKGKSPAGKKAKGRAAQRGKAQKGSPHTRNLLGLLEDTDDNPHKMFRGFQQGRRGSFVASNGSVKLRNQAIAFVSAGNIAPVVEREVEVEVTVTAAIPGEESEDELEDEEDDDEDEDHEQDHEMNDEDDSLQTNIMTDTVEAPNGAMAHMHLQSSAEAGPSKTNSFRAQEDRSGELPVRSIAAEEPTSFFVDTEGDSALAGSSTRLSKPLVPRAPSPTLSESSDEVVVFHGRNAPSSTTAYAASTRAESKAEGPAHSAQPSVQPEASQTPEPEVTDALLAALEDPSAWPSSSPTRATGRGSQRSKFDVKPTSEEWQPAPSNPYWRKGKPRPDLDPPLAEEMLLARAPPRTARVGFVESPQEQHETGAQETVAALQAELKQHLKAKQIARNERSAYYAAQNGASGVRQAAEKVPLPANRHGKRGRKKDNRRMRAVIDSDVDDDAEEAAYDDYMENMAAQLRSEQAEAAGHYEASDRHMTDLPASLAGPSTAPSFVAVNGASLVVDGEAIEDDELLGPTLNDDDSSSDSVGPIGLDFSDLSSEGDDDPSGLDSSALEEELEYTEREQWEDEADLRQRRQDAMTDEQIARLLAKQQELGIDSEELVIDDGWFNAVADEEGVGDLDEARAGLSNITNTPFARNNRNRPSRRTRSGNDYFPDASALADSVEQYGEHGFDIMDYDRPSLRNNTTTKARKSRYPPELDAVSDEDLKETMYSTWEKDRAKKRAKKAEREELRAEGLLGKGARNGKANLAQKYQQGMTRGQMIDELRIFLQNDELRNMPFPPMDKRDRKALHEVASKLHLDSKSVGSGNKRFPNIYKTALTPIYSDEAFSRSLAGPAGRGFYKNANAKPGSRRAGGKIPRPIRSGGAGGAAVSLRNGEVVGGNAEAIGEGSVGHRLMQKMGWSQGMALGKEGEGRLVPVEQVMRSGKAGLG